MKKLLATLLASAMALTAVAGLTACGNDEKGKTLTVWAPEASHTTYQAAADQWKVATGHEDWTVKFEAKAEGEAETDFGNDPAAGADVFFFESGQITTMKQKLYLQTLDKETTAKIKARDGANADAVIDDAGYAWAFPATADNGYFMWYDTEFFDGVDMGSLDAIVDKINEYNEDKADTQKKTFVFKYDDGWYESSWFLGGVGVEMDWIEGTTDYYTNIKTKGLPGAKASVKYLANSAISTGDDGVVTAGFIDGTVVGAVRGTWIQKALKDGMGDDYSKIGAAKLPTFTVDDESYQMGSFIGGKFCGVNRYKNDVESIQASISLADYLTSKETQLARFKATGAIPSNAELAKSADVQNDMLAKAYAEQAAAGGYVQLSQDGLWDAMAAFGTACHDGTATDLTKELADLATALAKGGTLVETK